VKLREGELEFDFTKSIHCEKFDDPDRHGLLDRMSAVDFLVEEEDFLLLVEVKDAQHSEAREADREAFAQRFRSSEMTKHDLPRKYRDTFLYLYGQDRISKPIRYVVLLEVDNVGKPELHNQMELLRRYLPANGPDGKPWPQPFVEDCVLVDLRTWRAFFPQFPVRRIEVTTN
jgi:hypothetical protein